jgi:type IV secretion system protein VirD4
MSIYIHIPPYDKDRLSPLLTLFWAQIIQQMTLHEPGQDEKIPVLALLDEFGNMSRINKLKDGLSFLRSYRVRFVVLVQYLAQLNSIYGKEDAKGFLNSKINVAFALNDIDDAKFFSQSLGNKTVKLRTTSINSGHLNQGSSRAANHSFKSQALLTPNQLMQLSLKHGIALIEGANPIKFGKVIPLNGLIAICL